jgi:hypothetical protein
MAKAFSREEKKAEEEGKGDQKEIEKRLNDFEKVKLLGTGNFSVSIPLWKL